MANPSGRTKSGEDLAGPAWPARRPRFLAGAVSALGGNPAFCSDGGVRNLFQPGLISPKNHAVMFAQIVGGLVGALEGHPAVPVFRSHCCE